MIYINKQDINDSNFSLNKKIALNEYIDAANYYRTGLPKNFEFSIYKQKDIQIALDDIFHGKCAYCESFHSTSGEMHIEHFRPKGRISLEGSTKTFLGYWWLAGKWDNLLPACARCNITHIYKIENRKINLGKQDFFPLYGISEEFRKEPKINDEKHEIPLLINPSKENPLLYLHFSYIDESIIQYITGKDELIKLKGINSIKYFALNRPKLVKSRTEVISLFSAHLYRLSTCIRELISSPNAEDNKFLIDLSKDQYNEVFIHYLNIKLEFYQAKYSYYKLWLSNFSQDDMLNFLDLIKSK